MSTRRPNGDGSIRSRETKTKGVVWDVQLSLKDAQTGIVDRVTKRGFKSQKDAVDWKARKIREASLKLYTKPKPITMPALVRQYIDARRPHLAPSTIKNYERDLKNHIATALTQRAESVSIKDLEEFMATGPGPRSRIGAAALVKSAVHWASDPEQGILPSDHLRGRKVRAPRTQKSVTVIPSDILGRILEHTKHEQHRLLFMLGVSLGFRRGELTGLNWGDWDFSTSRINLGAIASPESNGTERVVRTKSKKDRWLPVPEQLATEFLKLKLSRGASDDDAVFITIKGPRKGERMSFTAVQYHWRKALERAGLKGHHLHELRHTFATQALESGVSLPTVSKLLGHAKTSTTLDTYIHVIEAAEVAAVAAVQQALGLSQKPIASKTASEGTVVPLVPRTGAAG